MTKRTHEKDVLAATEEEINAVTILQEDTPLPIFCERVDCSNTSKRSTLYRITFARPMYLKGYRSVYKTWTFCETHLPVNLKNSPQIRVATFAKRAKGIG